jgi:hypothetical protein
MNSTAAMQMPMRSTGSVAPLVLDARGMYSWQRPLAPVSAGFSGGFGGFVCVTKDANQDTTEITDTKAHGARRSQESST